MSFRFVLAALVFAPAFSASSFAADGSLTLPEAQRLALARSLQVVAPDAAVSAPRHKSGAPRPLPHPPLKGGGGNRPPPRPPPLSLGHQFITMGPARVPHARPRAE